MNTNNTNNNNTTPSVPTFKMTFDTSCKHLVKPTNFIAVNNNLKTVKDVTIKQFAKAVTAPFGYSFTCPTFTNNKRKNINWEQQSVFALDFDDGLTPNEAIKIATDYGVTPNVVYTSFSDSPEKRKFRVLFFLDKVITDKKEAKFIILNLMNIYEGAADKACKDYARMFFGGKECLFINDNITSYTALMEVLNTIAASVAIEKKKSVNTAVYPPTKKVGKTGNPIIYNRDSHISDISNTPYNGGVMIEHFDFNKAKETVRIFADFLDGKWLTHTEIFGIASNLVHIKGGMKLMKDTMNAANKAGTANYSRNNFGAISYCNFRKYTPQRLENFSPYKSDADHLNIINAVRSLQGEVIQTEEINRMSLTDAENQFKVEFDKAIADTRADRVYLFKVHTALGKTRMLENLEGVTIAEPTHKLKDEVSDRMLVEHLTTPRIPKFDELINAKLSFFYKTGLISKATSLVMDIATNKLGNHDQDDIELARDYLKLSRECYSSDKTVITTHQKAMFSMFKSDTLIFDEDPLEAVLKLNTVKIGDFIELEGAGNNSAELVAITDTLRALGATQIIETPLFALDMDSLVETIANSSLDSNIIDFLNSDYLFKDAHNKNVIHYINRRDIPKTNKLFIMSATASVNIYKKIYGDRLEVIELMDVEQKGEVIQNTRKSYSRQQLAKKPAEIVKLVGDLPVITFMKFKDMFENAVEGMHFGNCAGYDTLNGQDIAVVGTPHFNNVIYVMYAKALGLKVKPNDMIMSYQMIQYGGFKFKFMTYDNLELRNIQLGLIESELIQAIGRARTLRTDATVHLYSTLPLRQATKFTR